MTGRAIARGGTGRRDASRAVWAVALAALVRAMPAAGGEVSSAFRADCEALTAGAHRMAGTPEGAAAAAYVAARLNAMRPDLVVTQRFETVRLRTRRCELAFEGGRSLPLLPMRPNGIMAPVTPPEGVRGRLVYAGQGRDEDLRGRSVEGAIVVMDYNSGEQWLRVFRMGAVAVVFVREGKPEAWQAHWVEVNANIPRFYYEGSRDDLTEGVEATVRSEVVWEAAEGQNLLALFKGTAPVFQQEREEVLILSANLDSFGEVPDRSPGARGAANVAALLELAGTVSRHRPRRHVLVSVLDAQAWCHAGGLALYRALEDDNAKAKLEAREASLRSEQEFLASLKEALGHPDPLSIASPARRQLVNRLRDAAAQGAHDVDESMGALRQERLALQKAEAAGARPGDGRILEIGNELDTVWTPRKDAWNVLRRALGKDRTRELPDTARQLLDGITDGVRMDVERRAQEVARAAGALAADRKLRDAIGKHWVALHGALLLGDGTTRWGLVVGGDSPVHNPDDNPGLYGKVQGAFLKAAGQLSESGHPLAGFEPASANQSLPSTRPLWAPPFLLHSAEPAGLFGIYNMAIATCHDPTVREGTPADTLAELDVARVAAQAREVASLLCAVGSLDIEPQMPVAGAGLASEESLSLRRGVVASKEYALPRFAGDTVTGPMAMGLLAGTSIPNTPVKGAVVQIIPSEPWSLAYMPRKPYAFVSTPILMTDQNGSYALGPLRGGWAWNNLRGFCAAFDAAGRLRTASDDNSAGAVRTRMNVLSSRAAWMPLPPLGRPERAATAAIRLLSARDNGGVAREKSHLETGDGVAAWFVDRKEAGVKLFSLDVLAALNTGSARHTEGESGTDALGAGFPMDGVWAPGAAAPRSAVDVWRLNESRLQLLQGRNILDSALSGLHGRAEDLLTEAGRGVFDAHAEALAAASFLASKPVYRQTRQTIDDLVFAVLILLGLAVPFAFAMERLVVGAPTIYRQMSWFAGFFVADFIVLFLSHPAFALAGTPIIIFLGFAVLILSVLVISIVMRRFETEVKALQGMPATLHSADVSRVSTLVAAMQMGISTMRRRPMRTALTAITILLLTFTILSFASFGTQSGIVRLFAAPSPGYSGVWVHDTLWRPFRGDILDVIRNRWGAEAAVYVRSWVCPQKAEDPGLVLCRSDGTGPCRVRGVLGLDPAEVARRPDLRALLPGDLDGAVLLTSPMARSVGAKPGDTVWLSGLPLRVGPLLDAAALAAATDMDGSSLLPVDFTQIRSGQRQDPAEEAQIAASADWTSLPVDEVVVTGERTATRLGGAIRALTLYTDGAASAAAVGEDVARMLPVPVAATLENGVFRHVLGTVVSASGLRGLIFPLLLGGLVIFGTMLGSVADREREIYTFSALGLAPRHVASLFFAESVVYSVIGGMGGYLLAQGVVRVMSALAAHGWVRVPEMNMSSTHTLTTLLVVMATVLASAVYPAIKASKSANPGLLRTWRPPPPDGDVLDMVFPFTVSDYDITGVVSFIREHFDNHTDTGLGRFVARDTRLVRDGEGLLALEAELNLAPYDLGVSQAFRLASAPSEIPGIHQVRIRLTRASGQPRDWQRLNRVLLDDLRQQFLIWRSLPERTMDAYRDRTLAALGSANPKTAHGTA